MNKFVKLYQAIGVKKRAIRIYHWNYGREKKKEGSFIDFSRGFLSIARLKRRRVTINAKQCLAPTLDEAAYDLFEEGRDGKYAALAKLLDQCLGKKGQETENNALKAVCSMLYRDLLLTTDIIATTPVAASHRFSGLFSPDLIFFDESPHARELSTLISIAHYEPKAWIFSGDHRQTRPFLATDDPQKNKWAGQMLVSAMERAFMCDAITHQLLINHRAFGGLEGLASSLFYNSKMVAANPLDTGLPSTVEYLRRTYLDSLLSGGATAKVPRIVAHVDGAKATQHGNSWANHEHQEFITDLVQELARDPQFRRVSAGRIMRGTVLIISPYKEAVIRYKGAIRQLELVCIVEDDA